MLPLVRAYRSAIASMLLKNNNQHLRPNYSSLDVNLREILRGVHTAAFCYKLLVWDGRAIKLRALLLLCNREYNFGF